MTADDERDFNVFVGAETGILKGVNINPKVNISKNIHNIKNLSKDLEITCMSYGENEDEILMGLRNQTVKIYEPKFKAFAECVDTKAGEGPLVGIARFDGAILTAVESGTVKFWRYKKPFSFDPIDTEVYNNSAKLKDPSRDLTEEEKVSHATELKAGRLLTRMRQDKAEKNIIATGGKENDLQVWDLNSPTEPVFRAKNVAADQVLQLRIPVWVSDVSFISTTSLVTCSRHGHIRLYDTRSGKRRPVLQLEWMEKGEMEACTAIAASNDENQVIVGSSQGKLALWDFRKGKGDKGLFRKYKGCVGAIKDIGTAGRYFSTAGLDRFLRIYDVKNKRPIQKMYLKSRLNCVLMNKDFDPEKAMKEKKEEVEVGEGVDSDIEIIEDDENEGDDVWNGMEEIKEKAQKRKNKDENCSKVPLKKRQ